MNERLKELYLQAHSVRYHDSDSSREGNPPTVYWQGEVSAQRFAELIVRGCIVDFYRNYLDTSSDEDITEQVDKYVKQNFGIKE